MSEYIVILVTTPNINEAEKIVNTLLEEKMIACANIISGLKSKFWWKNKIEETEETLIIIKTEKRLFNEINEKIKQLHSYTVPEIIAIPIVYGNKAYLEWISECLKG
ncbi:MAG: divalent-cation tolerance protein CutA [Candidatus Methanomethylicia archaeon]